MATGIVMRSTGSAYTVRDAATGIICECRIRGKLRLKGSRSTNPVAVGDTVDYEVSEDGSGIITEIHPRTNYIIRRASNLSKESHILAANIDRAAIVTTLFDPEVRLEFIDRFLVTCEAYKIPATIILNKCDLLAGCREETDAFKQIYQLAGCEVLEVSAHTGAGMDKLEALLRGKTTLLAGNSGVGKSTLINTLDPSADVKVGEISDYHSKGRHTTTFATMYPLPQGGYIIDTPGIKGFGLIDIDPDELYHFFPEIMQHSAECQYYNCTHTHEPECAVRQAVMDGAIAESRYVSYLKTLDEDEKYRK